MSNTPPGWYPAPGTFPDTPGTERWWDGTTWTDYTRSAPLHPNAYAPGFPHPGGPPPGGPGSRRPGTVVAAVAGALVLAAAVVGGIVLLNQDGGQDQPRSASGASASAEAPPPGADGGPSSPGAPSEAPPGAGTREDGTAVDANLGLSLMVPEGWQRQDTGAEGNAYISTRPYACEESSTGSCVRAGVYTMPGTGEDPKAAAERDIAKNAQESYGESKSHKRVKAGKVTVAGQEGYLVRWKLDAAEGADGHVQSVAFTSPANGRMAVVRFGFDDSSQAPELKVMDEILKSIKMAGSANSV